MKGSVWPKGFGLCVFNVFGEDEIENVSKVALSLLHKMMKPNIFLDIPSFLDEAIKFQSNQFFLASYFMYYSIMVYLFL